MMNSMPNEVVLSFVMADSTLLAGTVAAAREEMQKRNPALLEAMLAFSHADQPNLKDSPYRGVQQWLVTVESCDAVKRTTIDYDYEAFAF